MTRPVGRVDNHVKGSAVVFLTYATGDEQSFTVKNTTYADAMRMSSKIMYESREPIVDIDVDFLPAGNEVVSHG